MTQSTWNIARLVVIVLGLLALREGHLDGAMIAVLVVLGAREAEELL